MKQKQVTEYRPNYPKKLIKGAILTTAAAVALAGTTGCELRTGGEPMPEPVPTDELVLDGEIAVDPGEDELELGGAPLPEPTDELILEGEIAVDPGEDELELGGEPLPDESFDDVDDSVVRDGEPVLQGKIVVPEDTENP